MYCAMNLKHSFNHINHISTNWKIAEYFYCQNCNLIFQWVHQLAQFRGYLIKSIYRRVLLFLKWLNRMFIVTWMLKIQENVDSENSACSVFFYEHAMLFLLELLLQGVHQYAQFRGSLISFVHAGFVEQKLVFWSNMQVSGSTCSSNGSN